jgi:hypothetical protein
MCKFRNEQILFMQSANVHGLARVSIDWASSLPLMQLLHRRRNSISSKDLMHPHPVKYEGRLCFSSDELCISELN